MLEGKVNPWQLIFSKVDIGISSNELVIPIGMGITDKLNNFIGYVIPFNLSN